MITLPLAHSGEPPIKVDAYEGTVFLTLESAAGETWEDRPFERLLSPGEARALAALLTYYAGELENNRL